MPLRPSGNSHRKEQLEVWALEKEHAQGFVLWALADKPLVKDQILDRYEEYLEGLGANRTRRRRALQQMETRFNHAIMTMKDRGTIKENYDDWTLALAEKQEVSLPTIPDSIIIGKN